MVLVLECYDESGHGSRLLLLPPVLESEPVGLGLSVRGHWGEGTGEEVHGDRVVVRQHRVVVACGEAAVHRS